MAHTSARNTTVIAERTALRKKRLRRGIPRIGQIAICVAALAWTVACGLNARLARGQDAGQAGGQADGQENGQAPPPSDTQPGAPKGAQPDATQGAQAPTPTDTPAAGQPGATQEAPAAQAAPQTSKAAAATRKRAAQEAETAKGSTTKAPEAPPRYPYEDAIRQNNLGVALMSRTQFEDALARFSTACVMNPQSDTGCLNMGIALLNLKQYDAARQMLAKTAEINPQIAGAWYNLGVLERAADNKDAAMQDFEKVAALDQSDADTQYFIGLYELEKTRYAEAIASFNRALQMNPYHVSAEFGLAQALGQTGDVNGALAALNRAEDMTSRSLGRAIGGAYGQQGKYSLAQMMVAPAQAAPPASAIRFVNVTAMAGLPVGSAARAARIAKNLPQNGGWAKEGASTNVASPNGPSPDSAAPTQTAGAPATAGSPPGGEKQSLANFLGSGACILDYDGDGKPDIFLGNADGSGRAALYRNVSQGGQAGHRQFANVTKQAGLEGITGAVGCAVGDYDNDGRPDLAVSFATGLALYHNEGDGKFQDVTDAAGVRTDGLVLGMTFVDYDSDGNLDLYVTRFADFPLDDASQPFSFPEDATAPGNVLWRNKGNGTFVDATKEMALAGSAPSIEALAGNVNSDPAATPGSRTGQDLLVTGWQKSPVLYASQRDAAFRAASPWAGEMPGPAAGAVALDFDHDGWIDLAFTHWSAPGISLWRNAGGKNFERVPLGDPGWMRGWGIAPVDYDNDGWVDLVAVGETFAGEGRILLLRNEGGTFRDVTHETGLDKIVLRNPRSVIVFYYDADGSPDLLITQNNLPPILLSNFSLAGGPGAGAGVGSGTAEKNSWLEIAASGDPDNKMGLGTRVDIFSGPERQTWVITGASGYLGQGPSQVHAGLGNEAEADVLRLLWPTGIAQDEMQIFGEAEKTIRETERAGSQ
jgi:tetratricopeptide (TPR) repeat protein